jgi:hypothetical protein
MTDLKRLCPTCGAANAMARETCYACGTNFGSNLPVPASARLPASWKRVGASLAVSAAALALRVGLQLAQDYLERRAAPQSERDRRSTIPIKVVDTQAQRRPEMGSQPKVRGWAWGRRVSQSWRSDGSSHVEAEEFFWESESD